MPDQFRATMLSFESMIMNLASAGALLVLSSVVGGLPIRNLWNLGAVVLVLSAALLGASIFRSGRRAL